MPESATVLQWPKDAPSSHRPRRVESTLTSYSDGIAISDRHTTTYDTFRTLDYSKELEEDAAWVDRFEVLVAEYRNRLYSR